MSDIYSLLDQAQKYGGLSSAYIDKMMHPIPDAPVISRERYILDNCKDRTVLDIGASGPMSVAIRTVAREYHSIDRDGAEYNLDLDHTESLPKIEGLEIVIAGEVIEHLSNPGHCLDLLKEYRCPVILTTVNAYSSIGAYYIARKLENVNPDHVAYYSYHTLKGLVERSRYTVKEWYWYNGKPYIAEGLIFRLE